MTKSSFGSYRQYIELSYFKGQEAFVPVIDAFWQFHRYGKVTSALDVKFIEYISAGLNKLTHVNDLNNVITLLSADAIYAEKYEQLPKDVCGSKWGSMVDSVVGNLLIALQGGTDITHRPYTSAIQNELVRFISLYLPHRMPDFLAGYNLPDSLPLIDFMAGKAGGFGCKVSCIVGVQHLFGTTIPLIGALVQKGVPNEGVFLRGKPYSTSHPVYWALKAKNYNVHPGSFKYSGELEYHREAIIHVEDMLLKAANWLQSSAVDPDSRAIVLDDGGLLIRKLHEPVFDHIRHRFVCVEQTRRGITELGNIPLKTPVVNVAESKAKLVHESPLIAASVKSELFKILAALEASGVSVSRSVLVIGYGSIGAEIADAFREEKWDVGVMDIDAGKCDSARQDKYTTYSDAKTALPKYQVIIGCTGRSAFVFHDMKYLTDGAILVSASSSDIEFSAWQMRTFALTLSTPERRTDRFNLIYERIGDIEILLGDPDQPCHFLYVVRAFGKIVYLVHGGFPVNMPGSIDPIEAEKIQLTRCLMFVAAIQATKEQRAGFIELNKDWQKEIIKEFLRG